MKKLYMPATITSKDGSTYHFEVPVTPTAKEWEIMNENVGEHFICSGSANNPKNRSVLQRALRQNYEDLLSD